MDLVHGRGRGQSIFLGIAPVFCAVISMASGVFGFRVASQKDPGHLQAYLLSLTIGFGIQVMIQVVLSRGKDRFFRWNSLCRFLPRPRTDGTLLASSIAGLLLGLCAAVTPGADLALPVMIGLASLAALLQAATFEASSLACVQDLSLFWGVQSLGALVRGLVLLLLPYLSGMHLAWVLVSHCAAAFTGVLVFRRFGRVGFRLRRGWRFLVRAKGAILSSEGGLRALRPQLMALVASGLGALAPVLLEPATALNLMLVTPYLTAYFSVFHQVIQPIEVDYFRKGWTFGRLGGVIFGTLVIAGGILWLSSVYPAPLMWVLPGSRVHEIRQLAMPLAAAVAASSLLLGFGVTDYLPLPDLKVMLLAALLGLVCMLVVASVLPGRAQLLWMTMTPVISLGFGTRLAFRRKGEVS